MKRKMVRPRNLPPNRVLHLVCILATYGSKPADICSQRRRRVKIQLLKPMLQPNQVEKLKHPRTHKMPPPLLLRNLRTVKQLIRLQRLLKHLIHLSHPLQRLMYLQEKRKTRKPRKENLLRTKMIQRNRNLQNVVRRTRITKIKNQRPPRTCSFERKATRTRSPKLRHQTL